MTRLPQYVHVRFNRPGVATSRKELEEFTRDFLAIALEEAGWRGGELTVVYCSRQMIRSMKKNYLGIDEVTDVLSFPSAENPVEPTSNQPAYLGDIAVCLPFAVREARQAGRDPSRELALLLVHGLLHLVGWDHDTLERERAMWAETDRLLAIALERVEPPKLALHGDER